MRRLEKLNFKMFNIRNTFSKLVISNLILILVLIIMLSFILYQAFMTTSLNVITNNSMKRLDQNITYMRFIREHTYALGLQLMNEPLVKKAGFENGATAEEQFLLLNSLKNVISTDNIIHSICLYNASTGEFITSLGSSRQDNNMNLKLMEGLKMYCADPELNFLPVDVEFHDDYGKGKTEQLISVFFVNKLLVSGDNKAGSALIINLKADFLEKSIKSNDPNDQTDIFVLNKYNMVTFRTSGKDYLQKIPGNKYVTEIVRNKASEGSKTITVDGKKLLLVYKYDNNSVWEFVSVSTYDFLFSSIYNLKISIILICLLIFIIIFLLSLLSSYNIYLPFDRLLKLVLNYPSSKRQFADNEKRVNDVQLLAETFMDIMKRTNELELSVRNAAPMIKKAVIRKIINGEICSDSDAVIKYDELSSISSLQNNGKFITVILVSIDNYAGFVKSHSPSSQAEIRNFIEARTVKLISGQYNFDGTDFEEGNLILTLCTDEPSVFMENVKECFRKLQEDVREQAGITISVSIGLPVQSIDNIALSYNTALDQIKYRFVHGGEYLACYDADEIKSKLKYISIAKYKSKLLQAIRIMDSELVSSEINKIFEAVRNCQYDYIMLTINQLVLEIINSVQVSLGDESIEVDFNNIYENLNKNGTLEQVKNFLTAYCQHIVKALEKKNTGKKADMINDALAYIGKNYPDFDLNLDSLANVFNLTSGYFGRLFFEHAGKSVNEYITDFRLSKAKVLLLESNLNINDISSRVGFANVTYFITVFKKYYGCTPNQYRIEKRHSAD